MPTTKHKIAIITPYPVEPQIDGASKRVMGFFAALKDSAQIAVVEIAGLSLNKVSNTQGNFMKVGYFNSKAALLALRSDISQFEFPYFPLWILALRLMRKAIFLDLHNVEYDLAQETKSFVAYPASPSRKLPKVVSSIPSLVFVLELFSVWFAQKIFCVSNRDKVRISQLYRVDPHKVIVIPNCVDPSFFDTVAPIRTFSRAVIFIGSENHLPNKHAIEVIIEQIAPKVVAKVADTTFVIIGSRPPRRGSDDRIRFLGVVEDVRPYIAGAKVAVAPIFFGGGSRFKVIEYLAQAKAVVSTTKGVEGLAVKDGRDLVIADDVDDFSQAVATLLSKPNPQMESNGHEIASLYSFKTVFPMIRSAYFE